MRKQQLPDGNFHYFHSMLECYLDVYIISATAPWYRQQRRVCHVHEIRIELV